MAPTSSPSIATQDLDAHGHPALARAAALGLCGILAAFGCGGQGDNKGPGTGATQPDAEGMAGTDGGAGGDGVDAPSGGDVTPGMADDGGGGGGQSDSQADGTGGAGDSGAGDASGGGDGGNCAGNAINFNLNVATASDPAAQRVVVDFGTSMDLPIGNAVRTVELWAYVLPSSWKGDSNTLWEYGTTVTNGGFGFDMGTMQSSTMATIDPYTNGPGTFDNDNQPSGITNPGVAQWIHFALTWDGTAVVAYVNGIQRASKTSPGNSLMTVRTALTIGGNPRMMYFNGAIDEFRMWNIVRTAADITSTMNKTLTGTEAGLVGYWKFDEGSGTTAADSTMTTGHMAHNGTLMSATGYALPQWIPSTAPIGCP